MSDWTFLLVVVPVAMVVLARIGAWIVARIYHLGPEMTLKEQWEYEHKRPTP